MLMKSVDEQHPLYSSLLLLASAPKTKPSSCPYMEVSGNYRNLHPRNAQCAGPLASGGRGYTLGSALKIISYRADVIFIHCACARGHHFVRAKFNFKLKNRQLQANSYFNIHAVSERCEEG